MIQERQVYVGPERELMTLYLRLIKRNKAAQHVKADLHVHSPASKDFVRTGKNEDESYRLLIRALAESEVSVFAITDHNTVDGYFRMKDILEQDQELRKLLGDKLILPGVEITCYQKHFVALFPESTRKDKLDSFLLECGIGLEERGSQEASAELVSPLLLCQKVGKYDGIILIAHCDAEHGLLQDYFGKGNDPLGFKGKPVERILKSPGVHGICYNDSAKLSRLKELRVNFGLDLALLQASDSHSHLREYSGPGLPIGQRASWIKLGTWSFRSLCLALKNEESRILSVAPAARPNPVLLGIAIQGGFFRDSDKTLSWTTIPFSEELNCIVGARGTGKSTLLDILKFVLNPKEKELGKRVLSRFDRAVVFTRTDGETYAISMQPESFHRLNTKYYLLKGQSFMRLGSNSRLQTTLKKLTNDLQLSEYLTSENIQSYSQKELFTLATTAMGPTLVTESLCALKHRESFKKAFGEYFKHRQNVFLQARELLTERRKDRRAELTSPYLENEYKAFAEANKRINLYHQETIDSLNAVLREKLVLTGALRVRPEYEQTIEEWLMKNRIKNNTVYEQTLELKRLLKNLFRNPSADWAIPYHLFTKDATSLARTTGLNIELATQLCDLLYSVVEPEDVVMVPRLTIDFQLNVRHGISNGITYRERSKLSLGQRAVGMLLLILHGATELGETRPLLIDQPEDDLDNVYIYHTLVKEFQRLKKVRQLLIATHNPNIPIAGDAENILVLESDGESGWVEEWGSIDREEITKKVLQILEGDYQAFLKRALKYGL